jgi:hypothetical protein
METVAEALKRLNVKTGMKVTCSSDYVWVVGKWKDISGSELPYLNGLNGTPSICTELHTIICVPDLRLLKKTEKVYRYIVCQDEDTKPYVTVNFYPLDWKSEGCLWFKRIDETVKTIEVDE